MADRKVILMRITIIFFIIIWSLLLPIYFGNANVRATVIAPNSEANVDYLISIAVEAYEQGTYEQAIEYFDSALGIDPNNIDALVGKGIALDGLGRYQEAIVYYDSALGIDPNNASALYNRGNSLAGLENCVEAIRNYDEVLSIDPNYRPALINKGACLGNLGRHQEAARYFEPSPLVQESSISEASTTEKNHFVLITNVGEKGYSLKNLLQSYTDLDFENLRLNSLNGYKETYGLQYISHGIPIDVTAITAEVNKGVFRFQTGEYQGAIVIFDEILRINILHPHELVQNQVVASLYNKALCLEQQGNTTGAEYYRNEARNLDSQYQGGYIIEGPKLSAPVLALVFSEPRK